MICTGLIFARKEGSTHVYAQSSLLKVQSVSWPLLAELTEWLLSVCIAQGTLYKVSQPRARPDPVMMRTMMMAMVITMSSSRISNQCHWEGSWEVVRVIKAGFRSTSASFVHCVHFTSSFASHFVTIAILIIITTRPKPAYDRQGLAGSWGQDTDQVDRLSASLNSKWVGETDCRSSG